jgi:hypothetical protein
MSGLLVIIVYYKNQTMSKDLYGGYNPHLEGPMYKPPDAKELEEKYGKSDMKNDLYADSMHRYLVCVSSYLSQVAIPQMLEKQLDRKDLDTICGIELFQLKKAVLEKNVLEFKNFYSEKNI